MIETITTDNRVYFYQPCPVTADGVCAHLIGYMHREPGAVAVWY